MRIVDFSTAAIVIQCILKPHFCGSEKPPNQGVGCEQCGLRRKLLGPGLGGSCTRPHKWLKSVASDAFSIRFDDGLRWGSIPGILDGCWLQESCGSGKPLDEGVGCEQCGLRCKLLGPGLGGSCTPPHKWLKSVANDAFSIGFDDGLGWGSIPGFFGKEGGLPAKGLGAKRLSFKWSHGFGWFALRNWVRGLGAQIYSI